MTREEAINFLDKCRWWFEPYTSEKEMWNEALDMAIEALKAKEWIPVSERLPRDNKEVLISCEWGVDIGQHDCDGWRSEWINHYDDDNVLAWKPLSEPYREESEA